MTPSITQTINWRHLNEQMIDDFIWILPNKESPEKIFSVWINIREQFHRKGIIWLERVVYSWWATRMQLHQLNGEYPGLKEFLWKYNNRWESF